jgi:hypothetical protein
MLLPFHVLGVSLRALGWTPVEGSAASVSATRVPRAGCNRR